MATEETSSASAMDSQVSMHSATLEDFSQAEQLTIPVLQSTKERLLDHLANHEAVLQADKLPLPDEEDPEILQERIQKLQTELFSLVTDVAQRELILKRLQLSNTLMETLYPASGVPDEQSQSERQELKSLVLKQCQLVSKILAKYKEINEMKPKVEATLSKKLEYTTENRKLMAVLKEKQDSKANLAEKYTENPDVQAIRERIQKEIWMIELKRNTLQGLILGSGVNWAQDEELTEMLLKLGKPLKL